VKLYDKLGIDPFKGSAESLARITLSYWQVGQKDKAKDLLAAAREYFPKDPTIESAARRIQ